MSLIVRWLILAAPWAAVGAVVNVLIAWTLLYAYANDVGGLWRPGATRTIAATRWPTAAPQGWPKPGWMDTQVFWNVTTEMTYGPEQITKQFDGPTFIMMSWESGAPCRSMSGLEIIDTTTIGTPIVMPTRKWLVWRRYAGIGHVAIPLWPMWPGFAINSVFYGALAWGASFIPWSIRRRWRRRRGMCARCGYSLAGLAAGSACPECGEGSGRARSDAR